MKDNGQTIGQAAAAMGLPIEGLSIVINNPSNLPSQQLVDAGQVLANTEGVRVVVYSEPSVKHSLMPIVDTSSLSSNTTFYHPI